jgi:cell division protease FtsH
MTERREGSKSENPRLRRPEDPEDKPGRGDALRGFSGQRARLLWFGLLAAWLLFLIGQAWWDNTQVTTIPYSEFLALERAGKLQDLRVGSEVITGRFREVDASRPDAFRTVRVDPELARELEAGESEFTGVVENTWLTSLLAWLLPLVLILGFWIFLFRRMGAGGGMGGGLMSVGKSKAKIYAEESVKVTFEDVAGVDEAKEELQEIVGFLRDPKRYERLGARLPKGVLLVGPPGTGKTLLARAVAGQAGVPFFSISGSEFVELFVGVGAARVRDLFEQARSRAPCIIFIDELDALARARGIGPLSGGHDEKEQTLNQLLAELDGFDSSEGVVLLAATNRPEIIDSALLRAGRFDRQILVDRPDRPGRVAILEVHLRKIDLSSAVESSDIAALTPGFTGADLANLVNESAILATREEADQVTMDHVNRAIERIVAGLEKKNRLLNPRERRVTAYHEMGHALVARAIPGSDPIHKVSIIPRGIGTLGYTIQRPTEDRFLMSRDELEGKMTVLLGGRAAESRVFGEISTGASDDLAKATDVARSMVTRYGMDETLGLVSLESERSPFLQGSGELALVKRDYSEETAREIDCAVRALVEQAFSRATELLAKYRGELEKAAEQLLEVETLTGDQLPVIDPPTT